MTRRLIPPGVQLQFHPGKQQTASLGRQNHLNIRRVVKSVLRKIFCPRKAQRISERSQLCYQLIARLGQTTHMAFSEVPLH